MSERRQRGESATSRYTADEWAVVERSAAEYGLTVGQYQRALALQGAGLSLPRVRRRPTADMEELRKLLGHVGMVGSNVNQIARALNAERGVSPADITEALNAVVRMSELVQQALGKQGGGE